MNDCEYSDQMEDYLAIVEHCFDVDPHWHWEVDLESNCIDQGEYNATIHVS